MLVLGGSLHHRGGIESFCERTTTAINRHAAGWRATWWPTDNAYLTTGGIDGIRALLSAWRRLRQIDKRDIDLVWVQWSTLADLLFLLRLKSKGLPVMATPHLGANARLQRIPALRVLCTHLVARSDQLALLFEEQGTEIALPASVPQSTLGSFLPEETLTTPLPMRPQGPLRLLHAGRLSGAKGTIRMVAICAALQARGIPFHAEIIGRAEPEFMAELDAEIASFGLGHAITVSAWMDGPALRNALGRADVLVHLSQLDSFPLIVLEALAAGALPIVSSMAGAASMVRRYDGLVVQGSSIGTAADWLAANDPTELRARGAAAARWVRHDHGWPAIVAKLERIAEATVGTD